MLQLHHSFIEIIKWQLFVDVVIVDNDDASLPRFADLDMPVFELVVARTDDSSEFLRLWLILHDEVCRERFESIWEKEEDPRYTKVVEATVKESERQSKHVRWADGG